MTSDADLLRRRAAALAPSYQLFYDDLPAAKDYLRDASPFTSADWNVRVIEERRLRERRGARREPGGRRLRDGTTG